MAYPQNPLDYFVTYTYHFELHIAPTWEEILLIAAEKEPRRTPTTATQCMDSLVISTITDAHHTIDNVRFKYDSPQVNSLGIATPTSIVTMTVTEPGGCSFFEKIKRKYNEMEITLINAACWLLKIFFVGRYEDNTIETTDPISIPLTPYTLGAKFDHRGGEYDLALIPSPEALTADMHTNPLTQAIGFVNKDIHLSAVTVQEALQQLQEKLNDNYAYFVDALDTKAKRRVRYVIEYDQRISGDLNVNTSDSFAPGEPKKLSFSSREPIIYMLQKIVMSSTEMNSAIAESKSSLKTEFYPGAFYPVYRVYYEPTEDEIIVTYKIHAYEGREGPEPDIDFEFDYLFAEPAGKNVDVINFEIKFDNMFAWLDNFMNIGVTTQTAHDPKVPAGEPGSFSKNTHVENKTQPRDERDAPETSVVDEKLKRMDFIPNSASPRTADQGFVRYEYDAIESAKLAFDSIAEVAGAHQGQQMFTIRGHYMLLDRVSAFPATNTAIGVESSSWCKVNIKDKDGNPFFYTGWYLILGIENIFANGQFVQNISTLMMPKEDFLNTDVNSGYDAGRNE